MEDKQDTIYREGDWSSPGGVSADTAKIHAAVAIGILFSVALFYIGIGLYAVLSLCQKKNTKI